MLDAEPQIFLKGIALAIEVTIQETPTCGCDGFGEFDLPDLATTHETHETTPVCQHLDG